MNKVILIGRVTSDIELRQTNDGTPYTYFTIAVNRVGNRDQTDFIPCVAWRGTSELMKNYVSKGSLIGVEGRMEVYTTQSDGQYNTRINVNVSQIEFLDSRRTNGNDSSEINNVNTNFSNSSTNKEEENIEVDDINFDDIEF